MLRLAHGPLTVAVDPERGAEIRSLRHAGLGEAMLDLDVEPILGRRAEAERAGLPDDPAHAWLRGYHGGWQVLFPNAGPAGRVGDVEHPYHGSASRARWTVSELGAARAVLRCRPLPGLALERTIALGDDGRTVRVEGQATNVGRSAQPYLWSEHPAFDHAPDARVVLGGDTELELPEPGGERFVHVTPAAPVATIDQPGRGRRVTLRWSADAFPHAGVWMQAGVERYPFFGVRGAIAIEPVSAVAPGGLAAAVADGSAGTLAPGETRTAWIEVELAPLGGCASGT